MAKINSEMSSLEMPGFGVMIGGKDNGPEYPCLRVSSHSEIDLPEGDFFFLAIGHVKRKEEIEEDDGTIRYCYDLEVHAMQPIESISDEKVIEKDDGSLQDDFDAAAAKMESLKEDPKDKTYEGDGDDED